MEFLFEPENKKRIGGRGQTGFGFDWIPSRGHKDRQMPDPSVLLFL